MAAGIPLGPYTLVRRLAKGGMAEIFLARKEGPEGFARELVVKRILPHLSQDAEFTSMFRDEARLVARLSHPNVVQVYDYGQVGGTAYLAMELVRGVDLRALITRALEHAWTQKRPGAIPPHHAAKILSFVCEGLASAHALELDGRVLGLVHRDVTPSNVLVSFEGAVKVADFGIAKLQSQSGRGGTQVGKIRGKHAYLSPEQSRGEELDIRSDLFNVGILLFETITGDTLFPHDDLRASRMYSASGKIPKPERLRSLPPPLQEVARKALAPKPGDRYADALSLRADLERYVRSCAEPSDTVELGRWVRTLFPDVLVEERRGPRAAGTVPLTTGSPRPSTPATVVDATPADPHLPLAETDAKTIVRVPESNRPHRRWLIALLTMLALGAVGALGALGYGLGDATAPPAPVRLPPRIDAVEPPVEPTALRIRTEPSGLEVRVDGEGRGRAPLVVDGLEPGPHRVEALRDGLVVRRVEVGLESAETREVVLEAPPESGTLRVASQPSGASVFVGSEAVGQTPLEVPLDAGEHAVRVELEGHEVHSENVAVSSGSSASLSLILRPVAVAEVRMTAMMRTTMRAQGTLAIATTPWCHVFIGRRRLGTTPLTNVQLSAGRHVLTLRSPGRPARRHTISIRPNQTTRVRLAL